MCASRSCVCVCVCVLVCACVCVCARARVCVWMYVCEVGGLTVVVGETSQKYVGPDFRKIMLIIRFAGNQVGPDNQAF